MTTPSTELVAIPAGDHLAAKIQYARTLAASDLLPKVYQGKPANVLLVMEYGEYLGLPPAAALRLIHIIDNKPVAGAELIAARVRQAGHQMHVQLSDDRQAARCTIRRKDSRPDDPPAVVVWTMDDAKQANLLTKTNWRQYPQVMLKWRATAECARFACPEVLLGVSYIPDEAGAQELTDDEADDLGVMTRHQRVEHAELRRMNEPQPGRVEKLTAPDPDDPWVNDSGPVVPPAAGPDQTAGPEPGRNAGAGESNPAGPATPKPRTRPLGELYKLLSLDEDDQQTIIAWLCPAWTGSRTDIRIVTSTLADYVERAADVEEARSQLWTDWRKVTGQDDAADEQASE